jgi:hypothetical protein
MALNLVSKLRTCPAEERKAVAIDLGRTGSDEAISELINMVEGDYLDSQLIAVEALGETRNKTAFEYLKKLSYISHSFEKTSEQTMGTAGNATVIYGDLTVECCNARGELLGDLHKVSQGCRGQELEAMKSEISAKTSYKTILNAIAKLESSFGGKENKQA